MHFLKNDVDWGIFGLYSLKAFSLYMKSDWIDIFFNDEHPEKAKSPIEITEGGISICGNDEHPLKAKFPISVTE